MPNFHLNTKLLSLFRLHLYRNVLFQLIYIGLETNYLCFTD